MTGFLGTRGTLMMDLVFLAMFLVVPVMWVSIFVVRTRRLYGWHKAIQLVLAGTLILAVLAFELEVRLVGWRHLAEASSFWKEGGWNDWIDWSLAIHLCFAIPTPFIWGVVVYRAVRRFSSPPAPGEHSKFHRRWGKVAAIAMTATGVTGWAFYWLAFAA